MERKGYVYILTNPAFKENWVKIGFTDNLERRLSELYHATGVPTPFEVYATLETTKYKQVESLIHNLIKEIAEQIRINKDREFFDIAPEKAARILQEVSKIVDDSIFSYSAKILQQRAKKDHAKGKPKTFDGMGIKIGDKIEFVYDPKYTAEVIGKINVKFGNEVKTTYRLMEKLCKQLNIKYNPYVHGFEAFRLCGDTETLWERWTRLNGGAK